MKLRIVEHYNPEGEKAQMTFQYGCVCVLFDKAIHRNDDVQLQLDGRHKCTVFWPDSHEFIEKYKGELCTE